MAFWIIAGLAFWLFGWQVAIFVLAVGCTAEGAWYAVQMKRAARSLQGEFDAS